MTYFSERHARLKHRAAVAAFLLVIAAGGILIFTVDGPGPRRPPAASAGHASPVSAPTGNTASQGTTRPQDPQCRTAPASNVIPAAPPRDLSWRNVGAVLVPASASDGPTRYTGAIWSCYAHSPMGAVLASYGILAALTGPGWRAAAARQIVPGPGQRAFIAAGEHQKYRPPEPGSVTQPVGFLVLAYTPRQATIEALADSGGTQYTVTGHTVAWQNGDWKLVVTPDGSTGPGPQVVSSSAGFVLWGGPRA